MLSYNALAHYSIRQSLHIQTENPVLDDLARMVMLPKLIDRHNESVIVLLSKIP
jgi:hypothetical protein